jgi:hypothetical protein
MTSHVYITINLFNLCQHFFLPFIPIFQNVGIGCWGESMPPLPEYDFFGVKPWFFSHEIPQKSSRLPPLGVIFLSAPHLTWNPGFAPGLNEPLNWIRIARVRTNSVVFIGLSSIYLYYHTAKYNGTEKNNNIIIT